MPYTPDIQIWTRMVDVDSGIKWRKATITFECTSRVIWMYLKSREAQYELWEDALGLVDEKGEIATRHYNKQRQRSSN